VDDCEKTYFCFIKGVTENLLVNWDFGGPISLREKVESHWYTASNQCKEYEPPDTEANRTCIYLGPLYICLNEKKKLSQLTKME